MPLNYPKNPYFFMWRAVGGKNFAAPTARHTPLILFLTVSAASQMGKAHKQPYHSRQNAEYDNIRPVISDNKRSKANAG